MKKRFDEVDVLAEDADDVAASRSRLKTTSAIDRIVVFGTQLVPDEAVVAAKAGQLLVEAK